MVSYLSCLLCSLLFSSFQDDVLLGSYEATLERQLNAQQSKGDDDARQPGHEQAYATPVPSDITTPTLSPTAMPIDMGHVGDMCNKLGLADLDPALLGLGLFDFAALGPSDQDCYSVSYKDAQSAPSSSSGPYRAGPMDSLPELDISNLTRADL